jgi:opacity protein-like surface antigen
MKKIFLLIGCAAITAPTMFADDLVENVKDFNSYVETPVEAAAPAPEQTPAPQPESNWQAILAKLPKISGYLQTGYNYNSAGNNFDGYSSFEAKRLRLIMDGNVGKNVTFRLQIEAFNGISGTTASGGQKNLQVMDAFATYKYKPSLQIRAGRFYTPMGYENYDISPATLETVDFTNICYRMACRNAADGNFVDYGRELGVMLMGDLFPSEKGFNYLSYNLALANGREQLANDNNKSKDVIAALTMRPAKLFNVKLSYTHSESNGTLNGITSTSLPYERAMVGAWYNNPTGWDLRGEYGYLHGTKDNVRTLQESGAYVLVGYHAGKFLPIVRWDMYHDALNKASANNYNRALLGCTYQPIPNVKIQLNYLLTAYKEDQIGADEKAHGTSHQILLMGLFKF